MDINDIINKHKKELSTRDRYANKGTYGKLLVIGGSRGMAGAAYLCSLAAFRTGIGMVKVFGPECNRVILQTALPEAMYQSMEPEDLYSDSCMSQGYKVGVAEDGDAATVGHRIAQNRPQAVALDAFNASNTSNTANTSNTFTISDVSAVPNTYADIDIQALCDSLDWADMVVIGPGLSKSDKAVRLMQLIGSEQVSCRLRAKELVVYDADALNIISAFIHGDKGSADIAVRLLGQCKNTVITPHIGEMSRLTGLGIAYIKEHQSETAAYFSRKYGVTVVLKDAVTVVADAKEYIDKDKAVDVTVNADETVNTNSNPYAYTDTNAEANVNADANSNGNSESDIDVPEIATLVIDSGCGAMAKAGSGDVLCGFIAGITAVLKGDIADSIPTAVYVHGRAGRLAARKHGCHSILAEDIANSAADAMIF